MRNKYSLNLEKQIKIMTHLSDIERTHFSLASFTSIFSLSRDFNLLPLVN